MTPYPGYLVDLMKVGVVSAAVVVVQWIVQYTATSPWWEDQIGRTVVAKDAALLVLFVPNCLTIFWPGIIPPIDVAWADVASLFLVSGILLWRSVVWYRIQRPWPLPRRVGTTRRRKDSPGR